MSDVKFQKKLNPTSFYNKSTFTGKSFFYLLPKITLKEKNALFLEVYPVVGNVKIVELLNEPFKLCIVTNSRAQAEALISFLKKRYLKFKNIDLIISDNTILPFKEKVDIIFLNESMQNRWFNKKGKLLPLFKEMRNVLSKNGVLIFGVKNFFNISHKKNILDRFFIKKIIKIGTFYYSKKILQEAGFSYIAIFGCYPDNIFPQYIYSLENINAVRFLSKNLNFHDKFEDIFFKIISRSLNVARLLSPSFIVFAFKNGGRVNEYFVGDLLLSGHDIYTKCFKIFNFEKGIAVKVLKDECFKELFKNEVRIRTLFRTYGPRLLHYDISKGIMMEEILDGETLEHICNKNPLECLPLISKAFDALIGYYRSQNIYYRSLHSYLMILVRNLSKYQNNDAIKPYIHDIIEACKQIVNNKAENMISNELLEKRIPVLQIHGDLHLKNIMYSKNKDEIFLIDWESSRMNSIFHDFFTFIFNNLKLNSVDNIINLKPKNIVERYMLEILKDKYGEWLEWDADFLKILALVSLTEKTLYYSRLLMKSPMLHKTVDSIKYINNLKSNLSFKFSKIL